MHSVSDIPTAIEFGRFRILPHRRELLADNQPVELGGRAFDVLMVLVEARGAVVRKETLMRRVWPDRTVDENNLPAQITVLRKAFGPDRDLIRTVPSRGYQFTGEIRAASTSPDSPPVLMTSAPITDLASAPTNLPESVSELIGREVELDEVLGLVASHRLVTLVGAGGIGKTTWHRGCAPALPPRYADGVWFVALASLSDPELVASAVAAGLARAHFGRGDPLLSDRDRAALEAARCSCSTTASMSSTRRRDMAEAILSAVRGAPSWRPAASHCGQMASGQHRLPPLGCPANGRQPHRRRAAALRGGAAVHRARARRPTILRADRRDARGADARSAVASTACRWRSSWPRPGSPSLGSRTCGPAGRPFRLLARGRRTALPRHQTLRATMDWSYDLLPPNRADRVAAPGDFAGGFTLEAAATAVAATSRSGVRRRRQHCEPGREVARHDRYRRTIYLSSAGHHARLCSREAG